MTTYEAAKRYLELGFHPIACLPREKKTWVEWKKFQTQAPTPKELSGWWGARPDANVALVFGRGTFAVDLDGDGAEGLLEEKGIYLPDTAPRSKTGEGFHVLLSSDSPVPDCVGLLGTAGGPHIDIRGVGYIVAPPSIHPYWQRGLCPYFSFLDRLYRRPRSSLPGLTLKPHFHW